MIPTVNEQINTRSGDEAIPDRVHIQISQAVLPILFRMRTDRQGSLFLCNLRNADMSRHRSLLPKRFGCSLPQSPACRCIVKTGGIHPILRQSKRKARCRCVIKAGGLQRSRRGKCDADPNKSRRLVTACGDYFVRKVSCISGLRISAF